MISSSVFPLDCFTTVILFFNPEEIPCLQQVSRHWKEVTEQSELFYWRQMSPLSSFMGIDVSVSEAIKESLCPNREPYLSHNNLYKALSKFKKYQKHNPLHRDVLPLHYIALSGSPLALTGALATMENVNPLVEDGRDRNLVHYAVFSGSFEVLKCAVLQIGFRPAMVQSVVKDGSVEGMFCLYSLYKYQKFFQRSIKLANRYPDQLSDDMKEILLLIKDDLRGIDSRKVDSFAKAVSRILYVLSDVLGLGCAVFFALAVILLSPSVIVMFYFCSLVFFASRDFMRHRSIQDNIRNIDTHSCFARFFRPPANPFEKYGYPNRLSDEGACQQPQNQPQPLFRASA